MLLTLQGNSLATGGRQRCTLLVLDLVRLAAVKGSQEGPVTRHAGYTVL